jgi:membrane fusion protein (multidrug efflux system)
MKKILNILLTVLAVGALLAVIIWKLRDNKQVIEERARIAQTRNDVIPVRTARISRQTLAEDFSANGTFQPYKSMALVSEAQGKVTQLNYKNGDQVSEGAVVLAVDNEALQIQLDITRGNLKKAESDLARLKNLLGEGGVTQQQADDAQNGIDNLKGQIRSLEKQMRNTLVKAPIAGTVTGKTVEKGAFIAPAIKLMDIVNINRLKMQVFLTEEEVFQVKKGQTIEIAPDLYRNDRLRGTVSFIDVQADNSKRFLVEIELANPAGSPLKAGMNGRAFFSTGKQATILALPRESIVGSVRDARVFVVQDGKAVLKPVRLGRLFGEIAEIAEGLSEGDQVVISGQINLEDGTKIMVRNDELPEGK